MVDRRLPSAPERLPLRMGCVVLHPPPLRVGGFIETGKTILQPDALEERGNRGQVLRPG